MYDGRDGRSPSSLCFLPKPWEAAGYLMQVLNMIQHLVMKKTKPALPWNWMYWNQSFWPSFPSPTRGRSTHPVLCPLPPAQTCMCCRRGWHHPPGWGSAARLPSPSSNYTTQHCTGSHCILCFFEGKAVRRGDGDGGCPGKDVKRVRPAANPPVVLNRSSQGSAAPALPLLHLMW